MQPGHALFFNGFFDPLYLYPADQQSYIVSKVKGEGNTSSSDSIVAPTKDRVQVEYQIAAYFKLNTDQLREFHEQLGLRYNAYTSSGWDSLIRNTFRQQIENALQQETRRYDVADIFSNEEVLRTLQTDVQNTLSERLNDAIGDDYFCGPTFTPGGDCTEVTFVIKKIDLPKSVVAAFEEQREFRDRRPDRSQQGAAAPAGSARVQELARAGVSGEDYVRLKAIESASPFWVLPPAPGSRCRHRRTARRRRRRRRRNSDRAAHAGRHPGWGKDHR